MTPVQPRDEARTLHPDPYLMGEAASVAVRRQRVQRRGQKLLIALAMSALVTAALAVFVVRWGIVQWRNIAEEAAATQVDAERDATKQAGLDAPDEAEKEPAESAKAPAPKAAAPPVPKSTRTTSVGRIDIVDVGVAVPHLRDALAQAQRVAREANQPLVIMLTGRRCQPCQAFNKSLDHALMQDALGGVMLMRVDLDVFREDLDQLSFPYDLYPAFFLLDAQLRPRDGIHGGEWDADIPRNMAPVMKRFVRGELTQRRHHWSPLGGGTAI